MASHSPSLGTTEAPHRRTSGLTTWQRLRRSAPWWLYPTTVVIALGLFTVYGMWTSLVASPSHWGPYLSPFYSPQIWQRGPVSPALWVLWVPLAFRASCYYYRKSYHRSFLWDPPACARPELRKREYHGETRLPFILNNLHRYALYLTIIVVAFLWYDAIKAFIYQGGFYIGLGALIMLLNVVLLSGYTSGCHSLRHLIGGRVDCFSCTRTRKVRKGLWRKVTWFNTRHSIWAWASMFSVVAVDIYIRLLQNGMADPHWLVR